MSELDTFTRAYITCALWTMDDDPPSGKWSEHHPYTIDNIAPLTLADMVADCNVFQRRRIGSGTAGDAIYDREEEAGHDFWLTRNNHGSGFWDGDWDAGDGSTGIADKLTGLSHWFGEYYLYFDINGKIWGN